MCHRRLVKADARKAQTSENVIVLAVTRLLLRRLPTQAVVEAPSESRA
jgi:hypothetical protein